MTTWNTDAELADTIDERLVATNQQIEEFFNSGLQSRFVVVAAKGMGKTLLLRQKRSQLDKDHRDVFLIPRNASADYVTLPASLPKEFIASMRTASFWQDIWSLSIAVSALLNFPHTISDTERESIIGELARADLPSVLHKELVDAFSHRHVIQRAPSSVLDVMLQTSKTIIEKMRRTGLQIIFDIFNRQITSGCFLFIDSFDQALSKLFPSDLDIWCNAQCGLLKAAWELSRHNRHVKVYVTIRQEAYSYFNDPEKINIKGSVLLLEYSQRDLERIFIKAIQHYENVSSIEEFVGLRHIFNGYLHIREPIFDYIHRHTIGVPRWLMVFGTAISQTRKRRGVIDNATEQRLHQKRIAEIVNRVSSDELACDYLKSEMRLFFKGDTPERFIDKFLGTLGSTVLSISNLQHLTRRFTQTDWSGTTHPFCLLHNLGLLGYVGPTAESTRRTQIFKKPYQFDWNYENILPTDPRTYYLIHPSLHHLIQTKNYGFRFNHVRIGDGLHWGPTEDDRVSKEKLKLFISYAHADAPVVEKIAFSIEDYLSEKSVIHDIWFDQWSMKAGRWVQDQMLDGLSKSDYLILIVSSHSLGSSAVSVEWKTKFAKKIKSDEDTVFPFIIDDTPYDNLPEFLSNIYTYRYEASPPKLVRLLEDVLFWKSETSEKASSSGSPASQRRRRRSPPST